MDLLINVVGGFIVEVGKFVSKCIYPNVENIVRFSSKIENLREEMEKLIKLRDDIKGKVEKAEGEGYKPKPDVIKWIEDVQKLENKWEAMQERITVAKTLTYKCCPKCSLRSEVSTQAQNIQDQLYGLKQAVESFRSNLMVENYQVKKVEFIPGPSIEGQSAATRNLNKLLQLLKDDKIFIIGVWGAGGVGKTTLLTNLNNELLKTNVLSFKLSFGIVIWVTVPKPPIDIRKVQAQIASRLNLKIDSEGSDKSIATKICQRLKEEKSFLLILDDVWEAINLDDVGVPQPAARSKVIITSRFSSVCSEMKTDIEMKVYTLDEDESWQLFAKNVGDIVNIEQIQPLAREIARECDGLPLAITVIGSSMRGKTRVELWEDALDSLRRSEPYNKNVEEKVYNVIKWSFDSLESVDIQGCFLYCSLFPAAIPADDLIHCWWAEGILGEHDTYEKTYNRGIKMVESLKDACLLESHKKMQDVDCVKMHDVVRDVAIWIANSSGNEHNSVIEAGVGLAEISHIKMSASVKRISFVLPDNFTKFPETTALLLRGYNFLEEIPPGFFFAFPALRVLNLSHTGIRALPSSINSLCQLRALILQNCSNLKELPPFGDLHNLQLLDCDNTGLLCLPQGLDKLTNLRLLNLPVADLKSISKGFFLKLSSLEMFNMLLSTRSFETVDISSFTGLEDTSLGPTSFDELSSLHKLTSLFIRLDSSSIFNRDHTWMKRLKSFHIEVGNFQQGGKTTIKLPFNKSARTIFVSNCETFSNGELSGMLQFASDLYLGRCMGLRKLIAYNNFNGLKSLHIERCSCDFRQVEEGSGQFDPLPNLQYLRLDQVHNLECVSDFGQLLGLRFSKLCQLDTVHCKSLTCLFNVGGAFSVPKHLEEIRIRDCYQLEVFLVDHDSSQTTLVDLEIRRVRKLLLRELPKLGSLGEPESMWEHLEELELMYCYGIRKLPLSIQTSNNIKVIKGESEWWRQLEWDDNNFKSNLQHCFHYF